MVHFAKSAKVETNTSMIWRGMFRLQPFVSTFAKGYCRCSSITILLFCNTFLGQKVSEPEISWASNQTQDFNILLSSCSYFSRCLRDATPWRCCRDFEFYLLLYLSFGFFDFFSIPAECVGSKKDQLLFIILAPICFLILAGARLFIVTLVKHGNWKNHFLNVILVTFYLVLPWGGL